MSGKNCAHGMAAISLHQSVESESQSQSLGVTSVHMQAGSRVIETYLAQAGVKHTLRASFSVSQTRWMDAGATKGLYLENSGYGSPIQN